ncbi:MAG: clpC, partial [Parachlamydiales bacterium]|nr:clpC [Parachlamydiales bacterium]
FNKLKARLARKKIEIVINDEARELMVEKGYVPEMGARPLGRIIEQYLEDPLAEKVLQQPNLEKRYLITVKDGAIAFIDQTPPPAPIDQKKEEAASKK